MVNFNLRELGIILAVLGAVCFGFTLHWLLLVPTIIGLVMFTMASMSTASVDIWQHQREVMRMSDQPTPVTPEINDISVMYFALALEELSEKAERWARIRANSPRELRWQMHKMCMTLQTSKDMLNLHSNQIKKILASAEFKSFVLHLSVAETEVLLDDNCDVTVVTAGFAVACGLPARKGYIEVQDSNKSKANPATGKIDKDPTGKWIKGAKYRKASLGPIARDFTVLD